MTPVAVILLVISTIAHTGWNLIGKRENPSPAFFLLANTLGCLCLFPIVLMNWSIVGHFTQTVWVLLIATGLFQAIYYTGLAGAYRHGDLSIAYPLARSAPVIMVLALNFLLGQARQFTPVSIAGIALVAVGSYILPMKRFDDWNPRCYLQWSCVLALVAAVGTSGYSIIDDRALRVLKGMASLKDQRIMLTLVYAFFEGICSSSWQAVFCLSNRGQRATLRETFRTQIRFALMAGIGIYLAYSLVLLAMTYSRNVSYVVAFRQLGIPLSAMLGITILKEPRPRTKLTGVGVMLAGLLLVAMG